MFSFELYTSLKLRLYFIEIIDTCNKYIQGLLTIIRFLRSKGPLCKIKIYTNFIYVHCTHV